MDRDACGAHKQVAIQYNLVVARTHPLNIEREFRAKGASGPTRLTGLATDGCREREA